MTVIIKKEFVTSSTIEASKPTNVQWSNMHDTDERTFLNENDKFIVAKYCRMMEGNIKKGVMYKSFIPNYSKEGNTLSWIEKTTTGLRIIKAQVFVYISRKSINKRYVFIKNLRTDTTTNISNIVNKAIKLETMLSPAVFLSGNKDNVLFPSKKDEEKALSLMRYNKANSNLMYIVEQWFPEYAV